MEKQIKLHHSVTEVGTIQVRQVTEYTKNGEIIDKKYGDPYTPSKNDNGEFDLDEWDDKTKQIMEIINSKTVKDAFAKEYQKPTGQGIEECIAYDRVIQEDNSISVRKIIRIFDEGKEVSKKFHRGWLHPGDILANQDVISKAIAEKLHTDIVTKLEA